MTEFSAPGRVVESTENLPLSSLRRDDRPRSHPMIKKTLAALLGALLAQLSFGSALAQISEGISPPFDLRRLFEMDGVTPTTATAEALQRVAPLELAPAPKPVLDSEHAPIGQGLPMPTPLQQSAACPRDMVLIEGEYCTEVLQTCDRWLDDETMPFARCADYKTPSRCIGSRVKQRFCMDRYEYTAPGQELPLNYQSFQKSNALCASLGKRMCTESEWNFACEGEEMRPYPYGFSREPKCNQDRSDLYEPNPHRQILADRRERADARPECVSPFGVYNMAGNMDESVLREGKEHIEPFRNSLKGGWWMPARNRCRPATTAHDDYYEDIQVGTRCCSAAESG